MGSICGRKGTGNTTNLKFALRLSNTFCQIFWNFHIVLARLKTNVMKNLLFILS